MNRVSTAGNYATVLANLTTAQQAQLYFGNQVATPAPLKHRHARTTLTQFAARLDPGRNTDRADVSVRARNLDLAAQCRGGDADRRPRVERGALALED